MVVGHVKWNVVVCCILVASLCVACESRHVGEQEQLVFVYDSPFEHETFNKPLVVGGRLEVMIEALHAKDQAHTLKISSVTSSDPKVLAITGTVANMVEVEARRPGKVTLTVEGVDERGRRLRDHVTWRTDKMASMTMEHECGESSVAYMLTQNPSFTLYVDRFNSRGERLSGFWHAPIKVTPSPAHVRRPVISQSSVEIVTKGARGDVHVRAKNSAQRLTMKRIGLEDVTHLGVGRAPIEQMLVGESTRQVVELLVGEHSVCEPTWPMKIQNKTPDVCDVTEGDGQGKRIGEGMVHIKARSVGTCAYAVGIDGHELSHEVTFPVGRIVFEKNSEGAGASAPPSDSPHEPLIPWWVSSLLALCIPCVLTPVWLILGRRRRSKTHGV